jgi:glycosyltransferase 2 family protein
MILGAIAFGLYVYFSIGLNELLLAFDSLNFSSFLIFYLLSFGSMLLVMFLWAIPWLALLRALSVKLGLRKMFLYYLAGDFVDRVIPSPGVAGEVIRAFFVQKETRNTYGAVAAAGITNRILAYGVVIAGLSVGIVFLLLTGTLPAFASGILLAVWLGAIGLFILLSFVSLDEKAAKKLVSGLIRLLRVLRLRRNIEELSNRAFKFLSLFHEGFKFFSANPCLLIAPIVLNVISFILNFAVYVLIFYSLGLTNLPLDFFIIVYFLAGAIQDGLAAFSVGSLEIILTNIFILYGIPPATSGVAAVLVRSLTFYFPLILGYVCIQVIGAKNLLIHLTDGKVESEK